MEKLKGLTCRLAFHAIIQPPLAAFDRALPDLESHVAQEER